MRPALAQHSLVRALAEEIVEAALRRSGEWAGLDAAETGNAPDGAGIDMRSTRRTARQECRMRMAFWASSGWMGEWKTVAMIAPFFQRQRRDCASGAALHRAAA